MEFENYDVTSTNYVNKRRPIGLDVIEKEFKDNFKDIVLLDAGCGTGNYTFALADKVKSIYCFDFNEGMIKQAKQQNKDKKNIVEFR